MLLRTCLNMALTITEEWIRQKVNIKQDNLDDARSLSLPGTYHEKITHFGDSLKHFSRLKSLDVSRNAVESLSGLENLKLLEKLNLYYNNLPSLDELRKLRANPKLQELDLRLNPVSRNEPDYRLFLIHMLPNLRMLDDRAVRDMERKAALMHFSSEQTSQIAVVPSLLRSPSPERRPNPRVEHVKSLAKSPFSEDDEAILSEVLRTNGDLSQKVITGSSAKEVASCIYPPEVICQMNKAYLTNDAGDLPTVMKSYLPQNVGASPVNEKSMCDVQTLSTQMNTGHPFYGLAAEDIRSKYPNLYPMILSASAADNKDPLKESRHPSSAPNASQSRVSDIDVFASNKAVGNFTPNPEVREPRTVSRMTSQSSVMTGRCLEEDSAGCAVDRDSEHIMSETEPFRQPKSSSLPPCSSASNFLLEQRVESSEVAPDLDSAIHDVFINRVSDLADKYWNGAKSLLKNQRFKSNAIELIRSIQTDTSATMTGAAGAGDAATFPAPVSDLPSFSVQRQMDHLRSELNRAREENMRLHEKLVAVTMDSGLGDDGHPGVPVDEAKLKSSLIRAQRDGSILRGRLQQVTEENKSLQQRISDLQSPASASPAATCGSGEDAAEIEWLLLDNGKLKQEIQNLKVRMKQSTHLQELAIMLQDSHRSLVQTNEHLLKDLNEARRHHDDAMCQLQQQQQPPRPAASGILLT